MNILEFDWESLILLCFTAFLLFSDKTFSKKVRIQFHIIIVSCFLLVLFDQKFVVSLLEKTDLSMNTIHSINLFLRPLILFLLVSLKLDYKRKVHFLAFLPLICQIFFIVFSFDYLYFVPACIYAVLLISLIVYGNKRHEVIDYGFSVVLSVMLLAAIAFELLYDNYSIVNSCMCVVVCIFYFYFVMATYKRDRLTGLMLRHNLGYEMEDSIDKAYDLVLVDVDNFKLINDKYGHDKGDDTLVTIVETTLKYLPKGCSMYRFGGDEFVVISKKVDTETLAAAIEKTNEELAEKDYRISYGIVKHTPGTDSKTSLAEADKAMYENKRFIKSEDIWDDMTGLYNLRGFLDELDSFRKAVKNDQHMVCLVGVDVERLSNINKAYGYTEGNLIITTLAKYLKQCLHGRDFIGHLGSDEFVVAIECESQEDSNIPREINHLQELIDTSYEFAYKDYSVKLNVDRMFIVEEDAMTSEEYVNNLFYIKQEDKDNRRKNDISEADKDYNEQDDAIVQDILDNNKLQCAFQPIVSAKDGSVVAYESLMRSNTDTKISPLKILKYAERNKRLYDVEKLTLFNSLHKFSTTSGIPEGAKLFINSIPGHFLKEMDFDVFADKYSDYFDRLVIEITEQRELDDDSLVVLNTRLNRHGVQLAIDDYGSGWSNTNNLLRFMPQIVKLDRLLITGIDRNAKKQFFVNSIVVFAKDNDMLVLAEGVETESELKTVIRLGIDLVQGYITSKPSIDIVKEIPENIKKIIVNENLKVGSNQRVVYTAGESCELSVVQLAMEDYSKINISGEYVTITGSTEYFADMVIHIKDDCRCNLTISDVMLNSIDDKPCLELGENCDLVLRLEGTNRFNSKGIYVPASSSLTIIGSGVLQLYVAGHDCFAIGTNFETEYGNISLKHSGLIELYVDGEECIGIGGGIAGENSQINLLSGTVNLTMAGVNAVGIGSYSGETLINILDTQFYSEFRVSSGTVIGSMNGIINLDIKNFSMDIKGSGTLISVLGSPKANNGFINLDSGGLKCKFSGQTINFIGGDSGDIDINIIHCNVVLFGEGNSILGFGTWSCDSVLKISESSVDLTINSATPLGIGAKETDIKYIGPVKAFNINGENADIYDFIN